jgi:flagellar FliL protein
MGDIMKRNILTIIILALGILNMILTAVIVFAVVPTTMRTNNLISKVAATIDLELQSPSEKDQIGIADIETFALPNDLTISLKQEGSDTKKHYALLVGVSLSINKKSEDYKTLRPTIDSNVTSITEIITDEFSKYTVNTVKDNKDKIKEEILKNLKKQFKSDIIIGISIGNIVTE